jgi:hypothetical protein
MSQILGINAVRWFARLFGALIFILLTVFALAQGGPPNPWGQEWKVNIMTHLLLAVWLGVLLGWKWEWLGGALVVAGIIGFCLVEGKLPNGALLILMAPGVAYLAAWIMRRRELSVKPGNEVNGSSN